MLTIHPIAHPLDILLLMMLLIAPGARAIALTFSSAV